MSLSRNQTVLAAIGAVTTAAAGALGYMVFSAYSAHTLAEEELDSALSSVRRLYNAEISPDKDSVNAIKANRDSVSSWREAAIDTASAGDFAIDADVNEASFKQQMSDDARVMSKYKGAVSGAIVAPDFAFGFREFVTGSELPDKAQLPRLQRQWADIKLIVSALADCGIDEIVNIAPAAEVKKIEEQDDAKAKRKNRRPRNKAAEEAKPVFTRESYSLVFRAKPAALVNAVNAFASNRRFITVDTLSFEREADMISAAIVGDKKETGSAPTRRSRRRARGAEREEQEKAGQEDQAAKGPVADPALEAPFTVRMDLSTYDFGSAAAAQGAKAEENTAKEDK